LEHVRTRAPICKRCSLEPRNRLAARLRAAGAARARADIETLIDEIAAMDRGARTIARATAAMADAPGRFGPAAGVCTAAVAPPPA
jgi:hypothetical protein